MRERMQILEEVDDNEVRCEAFVRWSLLSYLTGVRVVVREQPRMLAKNDFAAR